MKRTFLWSLFVIVFVSVQYYRPPTVTAQALKDPCTCEQDAGAELSIPLEQRSLENIVRELFGSGSIAACITERFAGGELTVRVDPGSLGGPELIATVEKRFDGSLSCRIVNQGTTLDVERFPLSRSAFNSCKASIRTLCNDIDDLL